MVSREMIEIILKAEDQASQTVKKSEQTVKQFGNSAKQANQKASSASQQLQQKTALTAKEVLKLRTDLINVGNNGKKSFDSLSKSEQDSLIKFNMLDKESQKFLGSLNKVDKGCPGLAQGIMNAQNKFQSLDNVTKSWSGSLEYNKSKLQLLGTNTESLRGKIQVVGSAITTYLGSKWDSLKSKVSSFGSFIKTNLSNAISSVRSKLDSLGNGFTGLGGIISSAIGGLGMASISQLTVGLAMNRDRMTSLTSAVMGGKEAGDSFVDTMDKLTDNSLVSLDSLGQAMSTIKMSTGMSNQELEKFTTTVNDVGQRAILMGKSGDEALALMQSAGRGLNGEFDMLKTNFGVTKEQLMNLGWSGAANDVEGYQNALNKALEAGGSMDGMMDTTTGKLEILKKNFRVAGRHVGEMFTPYIDQALDALNGLKDSCPGLFENLVMVAGGVSMFATVAPSISPMLSAFDSMISIGGDVFGMLKTGVGAVQAFHTALAAGEGIQAAVTAGFTAMGASELLALWPLALIAAAILAIGAVVFEVGKAFGWWDDIGSMLDAIWAGLNRLWQAFINHPDVQATLKAFGDAWVWLQSVTKPITDWLGGIWNQIFPPDAEGQFDIVRAIIDGIGAAFQAFTIPIRLVIAALQILYPYFLQFYQTVLVPVGQFLMSLFVPAWNMIVSVFQLISPYVMNMISIFTAFLSGQISLQTMLTGIWNSLRGMFTAVFLYIGALVASWARSIVTKAINAGRNFVSGIMNFISSLPGRISTYLFNVVSRIVSAGISWVNAGRNKASELVSAVISYVTQLPDKVYNEFINIGNRIMQAGSDLVNKAKEVGKNIVDGMLGAMGIHSPGTIQEKVTTEFKNMIGRVADKIKPAFETAKEMGSAIVDGFGDPKLETDVSELLPNEDAIKTQIGVQQEMSHEVSTPVPSTSVDTSAIDTSNANVVTSFDNLALKTGAALKTMVDKDKQAYQQIRTNDTNQLAAISTNLNSKMNNMTSTVRTSMNKMVDKNKTGMTTVRNTTKTNLDNMVNKTRIANSKMIDSWNHMKNGIVNAADKIKSDSTIHFNKLEKTIGSFYRKLQNPAGFGAGPGNGSVSTTKPLKRTKSNGFKQITNAMRKAQLPSYLSLNQMKSNPFVDMSNVGTYIMPGKNNKFSVSDLIRSGNIRIPVGFEDPKNKGAGSWMSGVPNHVSKIKNVSKEWGMKGPVIIGKYPTSHGFKVKEFLNGAPDINFSTFKQMAEDVFSQCEYDFYWDSEKYGNWMNAFQHGYMNCSDSSDALIAMAHACGLSASKVHGHWNQYGHFWANVEGHKMDTTGWMNQRNWTPAASHAGPAPKSIGFGEFINELKTLFTTNDESNTTFENNDGELVLNGEMKIIHEFLNLPENISEAELVRLINESTSDESWIKKLVKNVVFQKLDLREKAKIEGKNKRAKGVV